LRPPGEIRRAALDAAWAVASERAQSAAPGAVAGVTQRDVLARLVPIGVARHAVKHTWENLVRAGALRPVGKMQVPGAPRPLQAYAPVRVGERAVSGSTGMQALAGVARAWVGQR
jgi:hypothetical protein